MGMSFPKVEKKCDCNSLKIKIEMSFGKTRKIRISFPKTGKIGMPFLKIKKYKKFNLWVHLRIILLEIKFRNKTNKNKLHI